MLDRIIKFTLIDNRLQDLAEFPSPAIKNLPSWYKNMPSFTTENISYSGGAANETMKKCVPILDAMSNGYVIKTWTDVSFNGDSVTWSVDDLDYPAVEGHPKEQVPGYKIQSFYQNEIFKWINPWHIKTPKGYSCMFTTPVGHHLPFKLIEGVVDTDVFPLTINFPFLLSRGFEGVVPYGTPMVQVIPFKRDSFKSVNGKFNEEEYRKKTFFHKKTFMNRYKLNWWTRKEFK
jgi:hypothetical protein